MTQSKIDHEVEWQIDNLPNRLTIFRVIMVPFVVIPLALISWGVSQEMSTILSWLACTIFILASITDFFDGYFARKRQLVTMFGSFLDPIADKFLVVSALIMLMQLERIPGILVNILILREMYITSLRLLAKDKGLSVPVSSFGKWKTAIQMVAIPMLILSTDILGIDMFLVGTVCIYIAALFSIYSALQYSKNIIKKLKKIRSDKRMKRELDEHDD